MCALGRSDVRQKGLNQQRQDLSQTILYFTSLFLNIVVTKNYTKSTSWIEYGSLAVRSPLILSFITIEK